MPKTFKVLPFHKLLSGPLWPDAKIGDNIVQGYGQKICLKFTILDFPGGIYNKQLDNTSSGMTATSCHGYLSYQRETS